MRFALRNHQMPSHATAVTITPTRATQRRGNSDNNNGNNQGNNRTARARSPKRFRIEEPEAYSATGAGNTPKAKPKTSPTAAAKEALEKATKSHHKAVTTIGLPHALKVQTFSVPVGHSHMTKK